MKKKKKKKTLVLVLAHVPGIVLSTRNTDVNKMQVLYKAEQIKKQNKSENCDRSIRRYRWLRGGLLFLTDWRDNCGR
jgi:hypothetical protein